jgi:hypothetical protein
LYRWLCGSAVAVICATAALFAYDSATGPTLVRAVPQGQFLLYANLEPLRGAGVLGGASAVSKAPEYQTFIQQSGVDFERDVDELALSISDSAAAAHHTSTLLLRGRFGEHLRNYLATHGRRIKSAGDGDIFEFDRANGEPPVFVALLGSLAVITNSSDPELMATIAHNYRFSALPFQSAGLAGELPGRNRNSATAFAVVDYAGLTAEGDAPFVDVLRGSRVLTATLTGNSERLRVTVTDRAATAASADAVFENAQNALTSLRRSTEEAKSPDATIKSLLLSANVTRSDQEVRVTAEIPTSDAVRLLTSQ